MLGHNNVLDHFNKTIKKYKLYIAWLALLASAALFHFIERNLASDHITRNFLPYAALRDTCIAVLLIGFVYEWWIREEGLKAISSSISYEPHIFHNVLDIEIVKNAVRSGLQRCLNDDKFGSDVFDFLINRTSIETRRWYNYRFDITLLQLSDKYSEDMRVHYYDAIIDVHYNRVLSNKYINFIAINNNIDDYNKSITDEDIEWQWLFPESRLFSKIDTTIFLLDKFWVNGDLLSQELITDKKGNIAFRVSVPKKYINTIKNVELRYKIKVKVQRLSHFLTADIIAPTHGVTYSFDFAKTDIAYVNIHDVFASPSRPQIHRLPENTNWHKIEISIDDWVIPKSGIAFSWILKAEQSSDFKNQFM